MEFWRITYTDEQGIIDFEEYVSAVNENMALEMFEELFEDIDDIEIIDIEKVDESELSDEFMED